jgi:hypothetical protein
MDTPRANGCVAGMLNKNPSDCYILALPLLAISKLQLKAGKKFGVMAIFATGLL